MGFVVVFVVIVKNIVLKFRPFLTQHLVFVAANQVELSSGNGIQPFLSIFVSKRELMLDS